MNRILRNTFLTSLTGLKATMTVALEPGDDNLELPIERETPEAMLIDRSNWQLIQSAIEDLPPHYRDILLLCDLEEMSYREISETLLIPLGTVMSRLSRARNALTELVSRKLLCHCFSCDRSTHNTELNRFRARLRCTRPLILSCAGLVLRCA